MENTLQSADPADAATSPRPTSLKPKPEVTLSETTHYQPESPCHLSEAPESQLPDPVPPLHTTVRPPQPGSIQAIIREHCRSRLYVPPIAWTSKQPRLLGCRFVFKTLRARGQRQGSAEESPTQQQTQEYRDRTFAAAGLQGPAIASWWKVAVEDFLGAYNIRPLRYAHKSPLPAFAVPVTNKLNLIQPCRFGLVDVLLP
jgi:hypothetical protein